MYVDFVCASRRPVAFGVCERTVEYSRTQTPFDPPWTRWLCVLQLIISPSMLLRIVARTHNSPPIGNNKTRDGPFLFLEAHLSYDSVVLLCSIPPELHRNIDTFDGPKMFILISSVMTWALSRPVDVSRSCV